MRQRHRITTLDMFALKAAKIISLYHHFWLVINVSLRSEQSHLQDNFFYSLQNFFYSFVWCSIDKCCQVPSQLVRRCWGCAGWAMGKDLESWAPGKCLFFSYGWVLNFLDCWSAREKNTYAVMHPSHCHHCDQAKETINHLLTDCVFARDF